MFHHLDLDERRKMLGLTIAELSRRAGIGYDRLYRARLTVDERQRIVDVLNAEAEARVRALISL